MTQEHLYTVIADVYQTQEVFINQVRTAATNPDEILFAWVKQAVDQGFIKINRGAIKIKGTDDPKLVFRKITDRDNHLVPLEGECNIWRIQFLIKKDFYVVDIDTIIAHDDNWGDYLGRNDNLFIMLDFIRTSLSPSILIPSAETALGPSNSRFVRQAEAKYEAYLKRHVHLKDLADISKPITRERRRVEKLLLYWNAKRSFHMHFYNRDGASNEWSLYTVHFDYEYYNKEGIWIRQHYQVGTDINYALHAWADSFLYDIWWPDADSDDTERILNDQDRLLLMEKVSSGLYTPQPITGCTNAWSTYFSLSDGMVKLTIIKTDMDEEEDQK